MLSVQNLIEKAVVEKERFITVKIEQMDGEIKLRIPFAKEIEEIKEKNKGNSKLMVCDLIYNCCEEPRLNDNKLLEHFSCKEVPCEVVAKIFGDIITANIAEIILDEKAKESSVTKIKNKIDAAKN